MGALKFVPALLLTASAMAITSAADPAQAQATSGPQVAQPFDIPAQDAAEALDRFVRQTRFQLVYTAEMVRGVRTNAVRGRMSPRAALDAMLKGTGLVIVATAGGGATIRPTEAADVAADGGAESDAARSDIIVTGTRLDERFAGASPTQVVQAQTAREGGLLDTGTILRNSPQVSGPRSQLRYNSSSSAGGATREGPGAQTIALRGFNPEQTLVLVNGRRLVSSGTEGVPAAPDIGLIPQIIVDRYEILTEGASPTYGSDAIAGIVNVKLRQDFEGLDVYGIVNIPEKGGIERLGAISWGKSFSRGYITAAAEYRKSGGLKVRDAYQFRVDCATQYTRGPDGRIRTNDLVAVQLPGTSISPCDTQTSNRYIGQILTSQGFTYYATPGRTNAGVPGFSLGPLDLGPEFLLPGLNPTPYDRDGDGRIDPALDAAFVDPDGDGLVGFDMKSPVYDLTRGSIAGDADFIAPVKQFNFYSSGRYDLGALGDAGIFFEAGYSRRSSTSRNIGANTNPRFFGNGIVPETNPTNPCGVESPNCVSLQVELDDAGNPITDDQGNPRLFYGTGIPQLVGVSYQILGDNTEVRSSIDQFRFVGGIEGSLELLNGIGPSWLGFSDWKYSLSGVYSRSEGRSSRRGILRDRIELSLASTVRSPLTGELVCGFDTDGDGIPDPTTPAPGAARSLNDCVPVNLFAESALLGRRLTPLEESYVFGDLRYNTNIDLAVLTGFIRGNIGKLPGGPISVVLGGELRQDSVDVTSTPDGAASNFQTFYASIPGGAKGKRRLLEAFGEIGIPLLRDLPLIHKLDVSAAGRLVDDQFAGTSTVYTVRGRWELTGWLALRGTYGTAFRSPGLVELFQKPNVTVGQIGDPCLVPFTAVRPDGSYDPSSDPRSPLNLARCRAQGIDPTSFGAGLLELPPATVLQGGTTTGLRPETSTSLTAGFSTRLPLDSLFGFSAQRTRIDLSATYYELNVRNLITIGDLGTVFSQCYTREGGADLCDRIVRGADGFISEVRTDFINRDGRATRGVDFNLVWGQQFDIGARRFDFTLDVAGNYEISNRTITLGRVRELSGTPLYPKLKMFGTARLKQGDFTLTWLTSYVGSAEISEEARPIPEQIRTCLPAERDQCSFINKVDDYMIHNASITWRRGSLALTVGVNNVFDTAPPRVNLFGTDSSITNTLLNGNYSLYGRTFVAQLLKRF